MSSQGARLAKRLAAIPARVKEAVRPALEKSADELVATMRHLVPVDERELQESIAKQDGANELEIKVSAGSDDNSGAIHARWVEFGTPDAPQQAYFYPSIRLLNKRITRRISTSIRKAVREEFGK